jgi:hypothetical protein
VVNRQLPIPEYDIFIGIIWRRFGAPTKRAGSGTEEEFRIAYESWKRNREPREILFYFCQAPVSPQMTVEEVSVRGPRGKTAAGGYWSGQYDMLAIAGHPMTRPRPGSRRP